jgi:hypothetical protein
MMSRTFIAVTSPGLCKILAKGRRPYIFAGEKHRGTSQRKDGNPFAPLLLAPPKRGDDFGVRNADRGMR